MSGIGTTELIVLVVVGLLILGPERLPRVATQIGRWVGRARRTANQLRYQLEREVSLADIEGRKKKAQDAQSNKSSDAAEHASEAADSGVSTANAESGETEGGSEPKSEPAGRSDDGAKQD